jgi:hypothetical protein
LCCVDEVSEPAMSIFKWAQSRPAKLCFFSLLIKWAGLGSKRFGMTVLHMGLRPPRYKWLSLITNDPIMN